MAVAFAAITYRQNSRDRRSAQARKVYAKELTSGSAGRLTYEPGDVVPDLSDGAVSALYQQGAINVGAMPSQGTWIAAARAVRIVVELHNESDEPILRWFPRLYDYGLRAEYDIPNGRWVWSIPTQSPALSCWPSTRIPIRVNLGS